MAPSFLQILLLGLIQGFTELLPVSSSAHVIVAEKLMGLDPSSPEMVFMLVMLHTGTMFAVIVYFWRAWIANFFSSREQFRATIANILVATLYTGFIGLGLQVLIDRFFAHGSGTFEVEDLFSRLPLIGAGLAAAGVLIIFSGRREKAEEAENGGSFMSVATASWIGVVQGVTLPFRGFSRSGATISTGMLLDINKTRAEEFSFALAVVLTPAVIGRELLRLLRAHAEATEPLHFLELTLPGLVGMFASFFAGLLALRLLSSWLQAGRWWYFGVYCLVAAAIVFALASAGF